MAEDEKKSGVKNRKTLIVGIIVVVAVIGVIAAVLLNREDDGLKYAINGVTLLDDSGVYDTLEPGSVALEFKNDAYSQDGKTFVCYLGNSALNTYDMYVAIYADAELTDELCVTDMVPPGSGFEELTLNRALPEGDHRVYVAFTQMEDPRTIHGQTIYTMDFHVIPD